MKVDYDLLQEIMEEIEAQETAFSGCSISEPDIPNRIAGAPKQTPEQKAEIADYNKRAYHYRMLIDAELIKGKVDTPNEMNKLIQPKSISYGDLTLAGHEYLDKLRDKKPLRFSL